MSSVSRFNAGGPGHGVLSAAGEGVSKTKSSSKKWQDRELQRICMEDEHPKHGVVCLHCLGDMQPGLFNRKGVSQNVDGTKYVGAFVNMLRHGLGKLFDNDGNLVYEGSFEKGNRCGQGVRYCADGSKYAGNWLDDMQHGQGVMYYPNGQKLY